MGWAGLAVIDFFDIHKRAIATLLVGKVDGSTGCNSQFCPSPALSADQTDLARNIVRSS
jgi:hypothetical protein